MPPADFSAVEDLLGASILSTMSNATLTLPDGVTTVVGILRNRGREAQVGMGMLTHEIEFICSLAEAPALGEGDAVEVNYRGVSTDYLVAERLSDDLHLQHAAVALRRP